LRALDEGAGVAALEVGDSRTLPRTEIEPERCGAREGAPPRMTCGTPAFTGPSLALHRGPTDVFVCRASRPTPLRTIRSRVLRSPVCSALRNGAARAGRGGRKRGEVRCPPARRSRSAGPGSVRPGWRHPPKSPGPPGTQMPLERSHVVPVQLGDSVLWLVATNPRRVPAQRVAPEHRQLLAQWNMHLAVMALKGFDICRGVLPENNESNHGGLLSPLKRNDRPSLFRPERNTSSSSSDEVAGCATGPRGSRGIGVTLSSSPDGAVVTADRVGVVDGAVVVHLTHRPEASAATGG
jgi:hypothetical protein